MTPDLPVYVGIDPGMLVYTPLCLLNSPHDGEVRVYSTKSTFIDGLMRTSSPSSKDAPGTGGYGRVDRCRK